jgi:hypothetical protein
MGRFSPIPTVFSESLSRVIAALLKVNPRERPTAAQALSMNEIQEKIASFHNVHKERQNMENFLINTIKVPQALKKLNEVLPRPCYPDLNLPRPPQDPVEQVQVKEISPRPVPRIPQAPPRIPLNHRYIR